MLVELGDDRGSEGMSFAGELESDVEVVGLTTITLPEEALNVSLIMCLPDEWGAVLVILTDPLTLE